MARNRKRAKERRARRPQAVTGRARVAAARAEVEGAPSPLGQAAPDAELLEAQLAMGEAGLVGEDALEPEEAPLEDDGGEPADAEATGPGGYDAVDGGGGQPPVPPGGGGEVAFPGPGVPEPRASPRNRLLGFLEGSWRELQRVQWPDRRQTMQATAVVIGFVIVAGIFLGVADTLASHLMSYILTGAKSALAWVAIAVIVASLAGWSFFADRRR